MSLGQRPKADATLATRPTIVGGLDFFARRWHFVEHLWPIWAALPSRLRGVFYVALGFRSRMPSLGTIEELAPRRADMDPLLIYPPSGPNPIVTAAYGDMQHAHAGGPARKLVLMEHGVGLTFPTKHPGYAGGKGLRKKVDLFLAPNAYIARKTAASLPEARQAVIGTPKLDGWHRWRRRVRGLSDPPTVALAFHWDNTLCGESGTAWPWYSEHLGTLTERFRVIGHGHPKIIDALEPHYRMAGIRVERNWSKVAYAADVLLCDASSVLYEFACLDKPVVFLNAPWFRDHAQWGIRFWDYTDFGPHCNDPSGLVRATDLALSSAARYGPARRKMRDDLFPYFETGSAAGMAALALEGYVGRLNQG